MLLETLELVDGIVKLRIGIADLLAIDHQFEPFGEFGIFAMFFTQGRHLHRVVGNERWLDEMGFAFFAKDLVDDLAFSHGGIQFNTQAFGLCVKVGLIQTRYIQSGILFDGIEHGDPPEGPLEIDFGIPNRHFRCAMQIHCHLFDHLLGEIHHPVVILVGDIDLHNRELRVMRSVHSFIPEIL